MIGKGLVRTLADAGMTVDWVRDGIAGDEALAVGGHALTLLDLGLGGMDGIAVLDAARRRGDKAPILVITARDDLETRIRASISAPTTIWSSRSSRANSWRESGRCCAVTAGRQTR